MNKKEVLSKDNCHDPEGLVEIMDFWVRKLRETIGESWCLSLIYCFNYYIQNTEEIYSNQNIKRSIYATSNLLYEYIYNGSSNAYFALRGNYTPRYQGEEIANAVKTILCRMEDIDIYERR